MAARTFTLTADGGSRGNPGPSAYGAVIKENGAILAELSEFIGSATNNVAEYNGLLAGLRKIHEIDPTAQVEVKMDSKLVVEQMSGRWQIKHANMRELAKSVRDAHDPLLITYQWIPRDENSHADRLANKALDGEEGGAPTQINFLTGRLRSDEVPTMIYFVRHGETPLTPDRKFSGSGPINPHLTEEGLAQAEAVAGEIAKISPEVLLASPLNRTRQTAEAIARHCDMEISFDEIFYEVDFGTWDGQSQDVVAQDFPTEYHEWLSSTGYRPPGGESYDDLALRVEAALEKVASEYPGQRVCVVSHNGFIRVAARLVLGAAPESLFHLDVGPCSITAISIWPSDGLRALRSLNERGHLR